MVKDLSYADDDAIRKQGLEWDTHFGELGRDEATQ